MRKRRFYERVAIAVGVFLANSIVGCASIRSLPQHVNEVDFGDNVTGKKGWSRYEDSAKYPDSDARAIFSAAKLALAENDFSIRRADLASGYVFGEHGMTPYDWNIVAGVYFREAEGDVDVRVIAQGSRDIGFSGDVTGRAWPQLILASMSRRLESPASDERPPPTSNEGSATGFFLASSDLVVTNAHVVRGAVQIAVRMADGRTLDAEIVKTSDDNDLATLRVNEGPQDGIHLCSGPAHKGEEAVVLGFPLASLQGQELKATFGRINSLSGIGGDPRFLQFDAAIQPGNSGSPLVSRSGCVMGIVSMKLGDLAVLRQSGSLPQNVNYAIKAKFLSRLLDFQTAQPSTNSREADIVGLIAEVERSVVQVFVKW